jgi:predicted MPP superfamily phosphohydrolase
MKRYFLLTLLMAIVAIGYAGNALPPKLCFTNGKFKIVQFTDLHWVADKVAYNDSTIQLMTKIIKDEKPDLAIITGDIITWNKPDKAIASWKYLSAFFSKMKLPFAVTFGNHDPENDTLKTKTIMQILKKNPYNKTYDVKPKLSGEGNCYLPIMSSNGKEKKWILYLFDSHDYSKAPISGVYGWIKHDQVEWYRNISDQLNLNKKIKMPALAFFHIPLPEYIASDKTKVYGNLKDTERGSPELNSGLFYAFVEKQDVIGVFVGHDHNNDYVYVYDNICLGFGRKTGFNPAYKELLNRGGRIIILHENERVFDTYIIDTAGRCLDYTFKQNTTNKK